MENSRTNSIANSLANQIADKSIRIANLETVIAEQHATIENLEKELNEIREKEIEEMDKKMKNSNS